MFNPSFKAHINYPQSTMGLNEATNWRMSLHSTSLHLPTELTQ